MKTKRLLAVMLTLALVFALAVPMASASTEFIPITSDQSIIVAIHGRAIVRPVSPLPVAYAVTYEARSSTGIPGAAVGQVVNSTEIVNYNGVPQTVPVGIVTGLSAGTLTIDAKIGGMVVGSTTITVRSSLGTGTTTLSAGSILLAPGATTQITAGGGAISGAFASGEGAPYFPVTSSGVVTCNVPAGGAGFATITAYDLSGRMGQIRIFGGTFPNNTVSTTKMNLNIGDTTQLFLPTGYPTATGSSNPAVATVTEAGLVKGVSNGTATIYCLSKTGNSAGQITLTVGTGGMGGTTGVSLLKNPIAVGETTIINAGNAAILSATSSNAAVAAVNGITITGVSAGTAIITYITNTGATGQLPVVVTAATGGGTTDPNLPAPTKSYSVAAGASKTFKFTNTNVTEAWTANPAVASAAIITGSDGYKQARFTGLSSGTTTAYMKTANGSVSAITLTVSAGNVIGKTGKIDAGDDDLRVSIRKGASATSARLATANNGFRVTIDGENGLYYKIKFTSGGKTYTGFVKKTFVSFN